MFITNVFYFSLSFFCLLFIALSFWIVCQGKGKLLLVNLPKLYKSCVYDHKVAYWKILNWSVNSFSQKNKNGNKMQKNIDHQLAYMHRIYESFTLPFYVLRKLITSIQSVLVQWYENWEMREKKTAQNQTDFNWIRHFFWKQS